jgi:hypothetical protein
MQQLKGKALKRAFETQDSHRIGKDEIPLIIDQTVTITPAMAMELLEKNKHNRPVNWRKVEEYAEIMRKGGWKFHSQGIILDPDGNIITGQKRLWAIVYADIPVTMRISKGCPADTAHLIDRGTPQTARDLATRLTEKRHSPTEGSIARAACALDGDVRPSTEQIAAMIAKIYDNSMTVLKENKGLKKTKAVLMIVAAICLVAESPDEAKKIARKTDDLRAALEESLLPADADKCWNRGAAFSMAMDKARLIVSKNR